MQQVYVLGGSQSDFARNITREGSSAFELFSEVTFAALDNAQVDPEDIDVGHVGNFVAELFVKQGQLGGFFGHLSPAFSDLPTSRHEAACASGSVAILAAMEQGNS